MPVGVSGLSTGVASVAASGTDDVGHEHTCAVTTAGAVLCWGNNEYGQLGNGSQTSSSVPVPVSGLSSGIVEVSTGDDYTCALPAGGVVQCWGTNIEGELGDDSVLGSPVPIERAGALIAGRACIVSACRPIPSMSACCRS